MLVIQSCAFRYQWPEASRHTRGRPPPLNLLHLFALDESPISLLPASLYSSSLPPFPFGPWHWDPALTFWHRQQLLTSTNMIFHSARLLYSSLKPPSVSSLNLSPSPPAPKRGVRHHSSAWSLCCLFTPFLHLKQAPEVKQDARKTLTEASANRGLSPLYLKYLFPLLNW